MTGAHSVIRSFYPGLLASFIALGISTTVYSQTPGSSFSERVRIVRPSSEPAESASLNGKAEQQEIVDPPFTAVPGLIETPPIKGRASAFNWMLMPLVGKGTFNKWMQNAHPDFFLSAEKDNPDLFIELVGEHERAGPQISLCGMTCRRIMMDGPFIQSGVTRRLLTGRPPRVLVYEVNCSCSLNDPEAVRQYVERGGYLLVTGRDLHGVESAFPGYLTSTGNSLNHDALVDAQLYRPDQVIGTNLVTTARWYVPAGFNTIRVIDPNKVRVLCTSRELNAELPEGQGVLAAIFPYGHGYVMCLVGTLENNLGHFATEINTGNKPLESQLPDPAPKIHISERQGIAANFIEAGLMKHRIPIGLAPTITQAPPK